MFRSSFQEEWQLLVHVCRRWRNLVLGSPRRLNLHLHFTRGTRCAKGKLDNWPDLPVVVSSQNWKASGMDTIITALGQPNRVREVDLDYYGPYKLEEEVLAVMQVPFPELTALWILSLRRPPPLIPDSFLGRSAPRLQFLLLKGILFPGLSNLLLSATHLVTLHLQRIPHSWYISPDAMVTSLSLLSSLETLTLEFDTAQYRPDEESRSLPPPKRSILPALDYFCFQGATEYLEHLVTFINASQLGTLKITFLNQSEFGFPPLVLAQFIDCSPKLRACHKAHIEFNDITASLKLRYQTHEVGVYEPSLDNLQINISGSDPDRQFSFIEQFCNPDFLSTIEHLYIEGHYSKEVWENAAIQKTLWLQLLLPFTAVKNLYIFGIFLPFGPVIMDALQEAVGGRIAGVLPSLQNISIQSYEPSGPSGPFRENIERFVTARRLSSQPVAIDIIERSYLEVVQGRRLYE